MPRFALAVLLIALAAVPAFAEPPTGFSEFAWGTSPDVLREKFIPSRCRSSSENRRVWSSLECRDYLVEGLSIPFLRLDFEPAGSLAGYHMVLARGSYRAFRDLVLQRFGRPTTSRRWPLRSGAQMWWTWQGVSATLIENCDEEVSCVDVRTTALDRKQEQIRERERRDSAQSF
jgi:hypothetical protein